MPRRASRALTARKPERKGVPRREFLVSGGAALLAASCLPDVDGAWQDQSSGLCAVPAANVETLAPADAGRVLELEDPNLLAGLRVNPSAAAPALKKLLLGLTKQTDLDGAWRALLPGYQAGQIIGIKVNVLNDRVPTHPELVRGLVELLVEGLKLPADDLLVWDRRLDELDDARVTTETVGCPVEGTLEAPREVGAGRGSELGTVCIGGRKTHLTNILTRRIDHLINFAVMKNHRASGFTGCLKNNYGLIDNPGDYHDEKRGEEVIERRFERAIPEINALPEVVGKSRLWLLDATIGVCKGDTSDPPDCFPKRLLASLDPVALDARGREIRDEQRGSKLGPSPETISQGWLDQCEKVALGSTAIRPELLT